MIDLRMDLGNTLFGCLFGCFSGSFFGSFFGGNRVRGKIDSDRPQIRRVGHLLPIDEHQKTLATLVTIAGPIPEDRDLAAS